MRSLPLPPQLVEQARAYADGSLTPAEPRNAATVVLMRPGDSAPEVYLLQRQASMAFAAGMCVFPGGGVDSRDFHSAGDEPMGWAGPDLATWASRLGTDEEMARALVCAAVRETFEESGVMLAGESEEDIVAEVTGPDWEADRVALEQREVSLTAVLARRGLVLRSDLLGAWAGWLTPEFEPKRYRTWFFVADLPAGQRTRDVSTESSRVTWLPAAAAVAAVDAGDMLMLPPTYLTCLEVAGHPTPESVIEACADRELEMFMPEVVGSGDEATLSRPAALEPLIAAHLAR
ncbi:NUDIX hydrolase [Nocardioides donggukensis]|uniref:NUDIX hydrolase n=1 Tax=Nocardioides donggukensis TaxID=2774019 RepID=A0A927KB52_9ACTN|nr:NUDIX hydrolase [Nocardioides donggukensis]MBD8870955.1 NUDIX hydrolase [Nocardioides donggukensis]